MGARGYDPAEVARAAQRLDLALSGMHLDVARHMDMTPTELLALAHLAVDGDLSPGDLASRLRMGSGAVTALLDRLAAHGHIEREPHPRDRRKLIIRFTANGRKEAMQPLGPMIRDAIALVARLPEADRATVGRFIDDLAELVAGRAKPEVVPRQRARDAT